ncbi:MAG: SUMF1/EgtB/PvdO family nonheme iron enzyme [bacterium]
MRKIIYILLVILSYTAYSQSLSVFGVDASNFPTIKANFFAIDAADNQITNLNPSDFEVKEYGQSRTVTDISCPSPKPPEALSSVLVMDISGSMCGNGLDIAKAAANAWINMLPLGKSECALTSFSNKNYINQDFTIDKNRLINGINSLTCLNGTDFNAAMLDAMAGGVLIAKLGKYKRIIVLLSDGGMNFEPKIAEIIKAANDNNIAIYCVTILNNAPQCMKDFSNQTGGLCFENIETKAEAEDCYRKILMIAQGGEPCSIEWQSDVSCVPAMTNTEIKLMPNNLTSKISYQPPNSSVAKLEIIPPSLKFKNAIPGIKKDTTLLVTARNTDFNITNIISSNPAYTITPTNFFLKDGQSQNLTVSYIPADSGYTYTRFTIENDKCATKYLASGGYPGKKAKIQTLKLIQPNGGETFIVGMDTVITWEGVLPEDKVKIEYTTDNGVNWKIVADPAKGLAYKWLVPKTPSNLCLARVTANLGYTTSEMNDMVLIPEGTFQMGNTGAYSGYDDERPVHEVTITKPFLLGKYEVTQKLYESVMSNNPSYFKGEDLPVEQVSRDDAVAFCNKLSEQEGLEPCYSGSGANTSCNFDANGYRLPTEAEWEYACKAGTSTDFYNASLTNNVCSPLDANLDLIGWYCGNSGDKTHDVGQKEPNIFGLYDMSGNVWEFCWDWWGTYTNTSVSDPKGANSGDTRLLRGGSWAFGAKYCRCSLRQTYSSTGSDSNCGFRLSRTF